jgi:CSLREA domain-containing protein
VAARRTLGLGILLGVLLGGFFPLEAGIIFVNTGADVIVNDLNCSLREAIIAANTDSAFNGCWAGSGADVIILPPGTFTLSLDSTSGDEDSANEDDLDITSPITIVISPPIGIATIARDSSLVCNLNGTPDLGEFRIFEVHPGGSLSATNVILENGCADGGSPDDYGGGIYVQSGASLNLSTSTVRQNQARSAGGGILNFGTATLTDTTLSQNARAYGVVDSLPRELRPWTAAPWSGTALSEAAGLSRGLSDSPSSTARFPETALQEAAGFSLSTPP